MKKAFYKEENKQIVLSWKQRQYFKEKGVIDYTKKC